MAAGCKKNESDGEGPDILWSVPAPMGSIFSVDTFLVSATISDADGIDRIALRLADAEGTTVANVPDVFPQSTEVQFETYFLINRPDLEGGTYYLNIEAYDPESRSSSYREVDLNPVPWELRSTLIASGSSDAATVAKRNAENTGWDPLPVNPGDIHTLSALHIDQLVLAVTGYDGQVQALEYPDYNIAWSHEIPNNTTWRAIESVGINPISGETAVADTDQQIEILNRSGQVVLGFNTGLLQYLPENCALTGSRLYVVERRMDGSDQQFSVFFRVSGALEARIYFPGEVVDLFSEPASNHLNDHVVVFLNEDGTPRMKVYDPSGLGFDQPISLPQGELQSACKIDQERYLIQIDNTIYNYDFGGPLQVYYNAETTYSEMVYDPVNQEVLALSGEELHYFALQGGGLQSLGTIDVPGTGRALVQLRNR